MSEALTAQRLLDVIRSIAITVDVCESDRSAPAIRQIEACGAIVRISKYLPVGIAAVQIPKTATEPPRHGILYLLKNEAFIWTDQTEMLDGLLPNRFDKWYENRKQ